MQYLSYTVLFVMTIAVCSCTNPKTGPIEEGSQPPFWSRALQDRVDEFTETLASYDRMRKMRTELRSSPTTLPTADDFMYKVVWDINYREAEVVKARLALEAELRH